MEKLVPKLRFPEFKGNWEKKKIGEVCEVSSGGTPSRSKPNYWNGNIPWVSTTLIDFNIINRTDEYITDDGLKNSSAKIFPKGTLLMAMYGQGKTRGKTAILGIDASTNQACGAIIPNLKLLNPTFLFQDLCNRYDIIRDSSNQGGQENLSGTIIKSFSVTYPSLPEQQKIATFLTSVDERLALLVQQKEKLELYKKGVMQQIFSQKLRFKDENGKEYPDWEEKKLGDLVDVVKGKQLNKEELIEVGTYPCQNGGIEPSGYTEEFNTIENTITISEGGNSCGYVNFMTSKFWCGGHCYSLLNIKKSTLNHFLFQYLKFNQNEIMKLRVGSGLPNIQKGSITNFRIEIPCIEEQQKIASFLSAIDIQIEGVSKKIEQTKLFKKGLLQQMFV